MRGLNLQKKKLKDSTSFNWEVEEFLFNDKDYQHGLESLKELEALEKRLDRIIEKRMFDKINDKNSIYDVFSGIH